MYFGSKYVYLGNETDDIEEVKVSEVDDVVLSDSDVSDDDGETCLLDILDTAGQEEYSSLKDQYVRTGNGFVILYSITDKSSFTEAEAIFRWLKRLKDEDCFAILVANKQDLKDQAEVSSEEGKDLAKSLGIPFFETSALDGSGVVDAVKGLIRIIPRTSNDYKIVMLGSGAVGKSCVTIRFVNNTFIDDYDPTIEDSYRKMINVDGLTAASKDVRKRAKNARKAKKKGKQQPDLSFSPMSQVGANANSKRSNSGAHRRKRGMGGGIFHNMYNGLKGIVPGARSAKHGPDVQQLQQQQQLPQQQQQLPQQQQQLPQQQQQVSPPPSFTPAPGGLPPVPAPPGPPPRVVQEKKTDSNVVLISLSSLEDEPKLVTGDPVQCKKCEAALTEISKFESEGDKKIWNCEFCGHKNCDVDIGEEEIPKGAILDYMLSPATEPAAEEENAATSDDPKKEKTTPGVIVYCMDISSSMQAACAVPESQSSWRQERLGTTDSNRVSRLNCIQLAVERLAEQMKIDQPEKQIMLLVFSSAVSVKAGGAMDVLPEFNQVEKCSFDQLLVMGNELCKSYPLKPMEESYEEFVEAVKSLRTTGCTALGPALSISTGFVSKIPGSEIVLCTDGEPNVGVGSSSGGNTIKFYEQVGKYARSKNVTINILAVEGASCDLQSVSAAAEQSGGTTNKLNPAELVRQLRQIAQNEVVATSVTIRFFLHPNFVFDEPEYGENLSQLEKEVGSARKETDLTFRFKVRDPSKKVDIDAVPFQVQITYTKKNGMKCLRILSQRNEVTDSRQQMEENISATVMSVSAMKTTAHLAKQGKGKEAQHMLKNVKRMVTRGAKSEEQREAKLAFDNEIEAWDDELTYNHDAFAGGSSHQSDSAHNMCQQAQVMNVQRAGVGASKMSMAMKKKKMDTKAKQAYYSYKSDMM